MDNEPINSNDAEKERWLREQQADAHDLAEQRYAEAQTRISETEKRTRPVEKEVGIPVFEQPASTSEIRNSDIPLKGIEDLNEGLQGGVEVIELDLEKKALGKVDASPASDIEAIAMLQASSKEE